MRSFAPVLIAALALAACAAPPRPTAAVVERLRPQAPSPWRQDFGDAVLAALLARADTGALDVKTALARLARAEADVRAAQAARAPSLAVGLDSAAGESRRAPQQKLRQRGTPYLTSAYEVDLFGRLSRAAEAARAERRASLADVQAARLLVAADTVRAYLALRAAQAAEAAALERRGLAQQALALVRARAAQGRAGADDLADRAQALDEIDDELGQAGLDAYLARIRLQALTGDGSGGAGAGIAPGGLPSAPALAPASSDAADGRPDVLAAYERLAVANARRAEAVAAARPKFSIGVSLGSVDPAVLNLLAARELTWAAVATLSHDLLDGGRGRARIRGADADIDLADLAYRKAVIQAWSETATALAEAAEADAALDRARAAAGRSRSLEVNGERRHGEGVIDGVTLAELRGHALQAQAAVAQAQARALGARVSLALAMGGR